MIKIKQRFTDQTLNAGKKANSETFMEIKPLLEKFNHTIDLWIDELERYNYRQLCLQPDPNSWSLGQVYAHLIEETIHFFQQIEMCLANNENAPKKMSEEAKTWFQNNSYPNEKLQGPPGIQSPFQPESKAQLQKSMRKLKVALNAIGKEIPESGSIGKTKHPGHNYFNAIEWFQFAEMHLRHHFRQKERIDAFLKNRN